MASCTYLVTPKNERGNARSVLTETLSSSEMAQMRKHRQSRILGVIRKLGLDGLILFSTENVRYSTDFRPLISVWFQASYACIVTAQGRFILLSNYGDLDRIVAEKPWADDVVGYPSGGRARVLLKELEKGGVKGRRIGFDSAPYSLLSTLNGESSGRYEFVDVSNELALARAVKHPAEVKVMRRGGEVLGEAVLATAAAAKPGMTEADVSALAEASCRRRGAEGVSWSFATFAGENAAAFARHDSLKVLREGEFLIMGYAAIFGGYNTDITVTVPVGRWSKKHSEVYRAAYEGLEAALKSTKQKASAKSLRDIALKVIRERGFGSLPFSDYQPVFHGIGMNVYEPPRAPEPRSDAPDDTLEAGNTIAMETLILVRDLPKLGGVRVGQTLLVTERGYEPITWAWPESHFEMLGR